MTKTPSGESSEPNRRRIPALAILLPLATLTWLTLSRSFYDRTALDVFFSISLLSVVFVCLCLRPWLELLYLIGTTALLVALQFLTLKVPLRLMPVLALLGISSFLLLGIRQM